MPVLKFVTNNNKFHTKAYTPQCNPYMGKHQTHPLPKSLLLSEEGYLLTISRHVPRYDCNLIISARLLQHRITLKTALMYFLFITLQIHILHTGPDKSVPVPLGKTLQFLCEKNLMMTSIINFVIRYFIFRRNEYHHLILFLLLKIVAQHSTHVSSASIFT